MLRKYKRAVYSLEVHDDSKMRMPTLSCGFTKKRTRKGKLRGGVSIQRKQAVCYGHVVWWGDNGIWGNGFCFQFLKITLAS